MKTVALIKQVGYTYNVSKVSDISVKFEVNINSFKILFSVFI